MIITELKPPVSVLSDEEELDEEFSPSLPKEDDAGPGKGPDGDSDDGAGFGLDDDLIEAPGEEEF